MFVVVWMVVAAVWKERVACTLMAQCLSNGLQDKTVQERQQMG
jgi:hypothetical protein